MTQAQAAQVQAPYPTQADLATCDREPIRIPGSIQPHGQLFVLSKKDLKVLQASANADKGDGTLEGIFGSQQAFALRTDLANGGLGTVPLFLRTVDIKDQKFHAIAHQHDSMVILELEKATGSEALSFFNLYPLVHSFISNLENANSVAELCQIAAREIRRRTGYGRAMVYRFDTDWHGEVVAEDIGSPEMPSLIGHHFPAADIPAQARELYRLNRLRVIPDAHYTPVPLVPRDNPETGKPLDLSFSSLRSVSPVHVEYLINMKTLASMSISIVVDGKLWGLISCHNSTPLMVPFDVRTACDFIGQFLSPHIAALERRTDYEQRIQLKAANARLLALMTAGTRYDQVLINHADDVLNFMNAPGAAVVVEDHITLLGRTPTETQVRDIVAFISANAEPEIFHTANLVTRLPETANFKETASGLLAVSISKLHKSYVLWFRPEVLQTIKWSGDPRKYVAMDGRIHPRQSFSTWKEIVDFHSSPWTKGEVDAAAEFRNSVVGIVLKRAEEMASLNEDLEASNKELEAFSYTVSHDLRAPFRHIVGYSELLKEAESKNLGERSRHYLENIIESGHFAGQLVDNMLHFSKMNRLPIDVALVDLNAITEDARASVVATESKGRTITWQIAHLPHVMADPVLIRLVISNLLSNAAKYTRQCSEAIVKFDYKEEETEYVFSVNDNGVGFDMKYVGKLFGIFQRLHKMEDFEGTGIGLANVRRIVTRHGGRVWAEGQVDKGATFYFTLPKIAV